VVAVALEIDDFGIVGRRSWPGDRFYLQRRHWRLELCSGLTWFSTSRCTS